MKLWFDFLPRTADWSPRPLFLFNLQTVSVFLRCIEFMPAMRRALD